MYLTFKPISLNCRSLFKTFNELKNNLASYRLKVNLNSLEFIMKIFFI